MSNDKKSDYDKLTDTLDKSLLNFNLGVLKVVAALLVRPLAMCTEPFFRKNFGERYFTEGTCAVSIALWFVAQKFAGFTMTGEPTIVQKWLRDPSLNWLASLIRPEKIAWVMIIAYVILGMWNLSGARSRRVKGQIWHSMGRGESLFGREDKARDMLFGGLIVVFLALTAPALGFLFFTSQFASYYLAAKQQASFYNRYLDAMDAKIEADYLQRALDKGEPPGDTDGLHCPLPKGFKGEYRARVARVVAGGPFVEGVAPETPAERAQATRPAATAANREAGPVAPAPSLADDAQAALRDVQKMGAAALALLLRSKRLIRTIVILLAAVVCIYGGAAIFRAVKAHWTRAVTPPVAVTQPVTATPVPMPTPTVPIPAPAPPVVVDAQPQPSPPPSVAVPAVLTPAPPPVDTAAIAQQAALEKQRREEQERLAQEREITIEQITNLVAAEIATAGKFKEDCEAAFAANTNKIARLSSSYRKVLTQQNFDWRDSATDLIAHEKAALDKLTLNLPLALTNAAWNPQLALTKIQTAFTKMEQDRQLITGDLQSLATSISNTPAKSSFFNFKIKVNY